MKGAIIIASVTGRICKIKQPYGGYLPPKNFETFSFEDNSILNPEENITPQNIGLVVDYLTRFISGATAEEAFDIPLKGAFDRYIYEKLTNQKLKENPYKQALELVNSMSELDDKSIINACYLVEFDLWRRAPKKAINAMSKGHNPISPDLGTIQNIKTLVNRCTTLLKKYGPITKSGFNFIPNGGCDEEYEIINWKEKTTYGGYTTTVKSGDGDFLTTDTLWDIKVMKNKITSAHTLQILMYWIMGKHSGQPIFDNIDKIGIFNPRLNEAHILKISDIPKDIIEAVEKDVICY